MPRVEFKAHCVDRAAAEVSLVQFGATRLRRDGATEKHFHVHTGHVRYYERESFEAGLIGTFRTSAADLGEVEPGSQTLPEGPAAPERARLRLNGSAADTGSAVPVVPVERAEVFAGDGWTVAIDTLGGYDFLSVEVEYHAAEGADGALAQAERLRGVLGIGYLDIVPWSYTQLSHIITSAAQWRARLGNLEGRLFLIDGPSGAGKSTLGRVLRDEATPGFEYVPRCSSRPKRPDDTNDEYLPIGIDDFRRLADEGNFLEYREFMFQMGYGLRWSDVAAALQADGTRAAYALVNLGNSRHIQRFVPDATTVLVTAPLDQLEGRMKARAAHSPAAIAERLENARRGGEAAAISDHVIENANGRLDDSIRAIHKIIYG
jgi:guanylate kinase